MKIYIGYFIQTIGTLLIAIIAYLVHHRIAKEKKIDKKVLEQMKKEQIIGIIGIILIIVGFILFLFDI